jgi:hypothetical protein
MRIKVRVMPNLVPRFMHGIQQLIHILDTADKPRYDVCVDTGSNPDEAHYSLLEQPLLILETIP